MKIKNDDALSFLRSFGFHLEERTPEGFLRYQRTIGNLLVTVANGQFENKIRISLLQDHNGNTKTSHKDILEYTELLGAIMEAGLTNEESILHINASNCMDDMENPLITFPMKPEGFMAQ